MTDTPRDKPTTAEGRCATCGGTGSAGYGDEYGHYIATGICPACQPEAAIFEEMLRSLGISTIDVTPSREANNG